MANDVSFDFRDTAVLVTGGTSGIGHAVATAFRDAGADVTVTGTRAAASDYDTDLGGVEFRRVDLIDPAGVERLAASLDRLDVLVNNAGVTFPGGGDEWDPTVFADALAINLAGPMRLAVACGGLLAAGGGAGGSSVVNVASMASFRANTIVPGYSSAKAGLVALTRNLAARWVGQGIRVNAVAPGVIDTPMTAPMAAFPELLASELAHIPMGRLGTPAEVAGAVLFLSSAAASYLTGATIAVDGGYLLG
ncbi:MAG: SDR family NAD(P)-dependent oxidoreductase [Actinomycetes bacterium]